MKKILLPLLIATAVASPAYSAPQKLCVLIEQLSADIMGERQKGKAMYVTIESFTKTLSENTSKAVNKIIIKAYDEPIYNTQLYRDKIVTEFSTGMAVQCYESLVKNKTN